MGVNRSKRPVSAEQREMKKLIRIMPLLGMVFIVLLATGIPLYMTSQPGFCRSCHIMRPYYSSWDTSTHARLTCIDCHSGSGITGYVNGRVNLMKYTVASIVGGTDETELKAEVDNKKCASCHKVNRKVSAGDLRLPTRHHELKDKDVKCTDCHKRLVHNSTPTGKNKPREAVCVKCHQEKNISTECKTCHSDK